MESILPIKHLWTFNDQRVYLLVAIARSKENSNVRATDQPTMRKVVEDWDELEDKLEQLSHAASRFDHDYRLYATVNGRNARDALSFLQKEAIGRVREAEKSGQTPSFFKRIDHKWKSILHQPQCRDEKRFLWDLDTTNIKVFQQLRDDLEEHAEVIAHQQTPNGWHIVTEPFNPKKVLHFDGSTYRDYECERKSDDMIFVRFL